MILMVFGIYSSLFEGYEAEPVSADTEISLNLNAAGNII